MREKEKNESERKKLSKELISGLKEDEKRRKVDDMKKRAILTSKSYEEFKNFVACADQKTVSSKEMADFRHSIKTAKVQFNSANHQQSNMDKGSDETSALRFGTGRKNDTTKIARDSVSKELLVSSEDVKSDRDFIKAWHRISKSTLEDKYRYVIFLFFSTISCL